MHFKGTTFSFEVKVSDFHYTFNRFRTVRQVKSPQRSQTAFYANYSQLQKSTKEITRGFATIFYQVSASYLKQPPENQSGNTT